jgi:DNA-binding NtrC family response regulator
MSLTAVLYEPDLLFSSQIESICRRAGLDVTLTVAVVDLGNAVKNSSPTLLIINLDALKDDYQALVGSVQGRCRLVGYYSHVNSNLASEAMASGFTDVIPRRTFADKLREIIAEVRSG